MQEQSLLIPAILHELPYHFRYKEQYEEWKKASKQFIKDIQNGVKTYEEFDKWLDENKGGF